MHCEIGGTQGPLGYVSALGAIRLVHWLILVAPSCLRSHNARYIMLKSLSNPPIAHCHPLLWGGGILVDHWSTISSSRGIMVGALFCPICQIFPVWFHCTMFRRLCCFRLTTVLENCHSDTLHNISRHKLATVFWNSMCEISFMTRFKQQRCRCFTVRWEFGLLNSMQ